MAMGTDVGDAYIDVHANSRPFRRELKKDARKAGREAGGEMGKGLNEGVDSELDETFARVGQRIRASLTKAGYRSGQAFSENMEEGVKRHLKKWNVNLADALITGDFGQVVGEFDNLDQAVEKVEKRLRSLRQGGRLTADEFKDARTSLSAWGQAIRDGRVREELEAAEDAARRMNDALNKKEGTANQYELRKAIASVSAGIDASERKFEDAHRAAIARGRDLDKLAERDIAARNDRMRIEETMAAGHRRYTEEAIADRQQYFTKELEGWLATRRAAIAFERGTKQGMDALERHFRRNPIVGDHLIDREGWSRALLDLEQNTDVIVRRMTRNTSTGMLGSLKGARNNFLNIVGIVGGFVERVIGNGVGRVFDGVGTGIAKIGDQLAQVGGGSGPLAAFGNGISSLGDKVMGLGKGGIDGLVVQLVILAATFQGVVLFIGPLVAGLSGLLGIVTALVITIGGALLGALGSLLPLVSALGIAAGAAVIGVMGMTDAMKDMLKPLEDWFERVKKTVSANLFGNLQNQVDRLVGFMDSALTPALEIAATSLSKFADGFLDMLNSPGVQGSMKVFRDHLPGILDGLGRTFTGIFSGITGIIAAAAPTVEIFMDKIAGVAEAFGTWANSDEGRAQIAEFFEKAAPAAEALFDIIGELAGIFGTLWEEGSDTGQTMLDNFSNALEVFNNWLGTKEGREELSGWFEYAEEVASKLAEVVEGLGSLFDKLDTPSNREIFLVILDGLNGLIGALEWMADTGNGIIEGMAVALDNVKLAGEGFSIWLDELLNFDWGAIWATITSPFTTAWNWIVEWFTTKKEELSTWFHELFNIDWEAVGQTVVTGISTIMTLALTTVFSIGLGILDWFIQLPERIGMALSTLGTIISGAFTTAFAWAYGVVAGAVASIYLFISSIPGTIGTYLSALPTVIGTAFSTAWTWAYTTVTGIVASILVFISGIPGQIGSALSSLGSTIGGAFSTAWNTAYTTVAGIAARVVGFIAGIPGQIGSALGSLASTIGGAFSRAWNSASEETRGRITGLISDIRAIPGKASAALSNAGSVLVSRGRELVEGIIKGVKEAVGRIGTTISNAISNIKLPSISAPKINMPSIPKINFPWNARGSIVNGAQVVGVGEAGPEAIVPLNRPLSQVDPAVRSLSAYAQGKGGNPNSGSGNITNDIKVYSPYADPALVAKEVVDAMMERAG